MVYQLISHILDGDGVSVCALSMNDILNLNGIKSVIITLNNKCKNASGVIETDSFADLNINAKDIIMYHFFEATKEIKKIERLECKRIFVFQNITNPELVRKVDWDLYSYVALGVEEIKWSHRYFEQAICMSNYSKRDLVNNGWVPQKVSVIPIVSLNELNERPNHQLVKMYKTGEINLLFVGRVAPNKKIQDVIKAFEAFQKEYKSNCRLFVVGSVLYEDYYKKLLSYVDEYKISNVVFTGKVSQADLEAYYRLADIFLCMSEHEGFCIPLLEAFQREVPVVAYAATAVPDTMGEAGVLVYEKDYDVIADKIHRIITDVEYRGEIIRKQKKRVEEFQLDNYVDELLDVIDKTMNQPKKEESTDYFDVDYVETIGDTYGVLDERFVIYGYGKAGRHLYNGLTGVQKENVIAICDNGDNIIDCLKHKECVSQYSKDYYIVTMQKGYVGVINALLCDGIKEAQIYRFNVKSNRVER